MRYLLFIILAVSATAQQPPAGASRAVFQKVCGACHPADSFLTGGRTREQWQETINAMVARGAKATPEEFGIALDYLVAQYGPQAGAMPQAGAGRGAGPAQAGRGARTGLPGSDDKHVVDPAGADRGRSTYAAQCITCHGTHARGTERGADLIRSELVLHDRYGNEIGPYLRKGHPTQAAASLTPAQIQDLAHLIHYEVYQTLRSAMRIQDVLTGDAKAGAVYFNGEGKCATCHSTTGDLAGIGKKYDPPTLQQRFVFPMAGGFGGRGGRGRGGNMSKPVTVTVTPPSGPAVSGTLVHLDDFNVALRDAAGEYRSWKRTPALKVATVNPFAAHIEMLDKYSDKNMHDLTAYLETLK